MKRFAFVLLSITLFLSATSDLQKKFIREGEFDIVCYVSLDKLNKFETDKEYFWYKNNEVHHSYAKSAGLPLHTEFNKFYRSKQLAESGDFNYGLKDGKWLKWNENGTLLSEIEWKNGYKHGDFFEFDEKGDLILSGTYRNNIKSGFWINHQKEDTIFYKKDSIYSKKPKSKLKKFLNKVFKKRDSLEVVQKRKERQERKRKDSINKVIKKQKRQYNKN